MEEYLRHDRHNWKKYRDHVMDLAGDATFVYCALETARHHRGGWGSPGWGSPREATLGLAPFHLGIPPAHTPQAGAGSQHAIEETAGC